MKIPQNASKVFTGNVFDVYQWEQDMYDGTKATFEALKRPATIQIIPTLKDKLYLSPHYKIFNTSLKFTYCTIDSNSHILSA